MYRLTWSVHERLGLLVVVVVVVVLGVHTGWAQTRLPDSPTGRMAGALLRITRGTGEGVLESFLENHVAPRAPAKDQLVEAFGRFRADFPNAEMRRAEKTGPFSAQLTIQDGRRPPWAVPVADRESTPYSSRTGR